MSFPLHKPGFQRFDAFLQFFMLKRLLGKLDDALSRPDTDVFPLAVQVLHQGFSGLGDTGLEAIQRAFNQGIPLAFKFLPERFVLQPLVDCGLVDPGAPAGFLGLRRGQQVRDNPSLPIC
jgi:hypothetical protein